MNIVAVNLILCLLCSSVRFGVTDYAEYVISERNATFLKLVALLFSFTLHTFSFDKMQFSTLVISMIFLFLPYLSKDSKLSGFCISAVNRKWHDKLIWTSAVYFIAGMFALCLNEFEISTLCFVTFSGSTLYHRNREIKFFNLDNIFATSLLVVYSCSLLSSFSVCQEYFLLGMIGLPVAAFLLVYCGMPAEVSLDTTGFVCTRTERTLYDKIHTLWHVISGMGPVMSVWYLHSIKHGNFYLMGVPVSVDSTHWYAAFDSSIMPTVAIGIGVVINLAGNIAGIMPLD